MDILDLDNKEPMVGHTGSLLGTGVEIAGLFASAILADKVKSAGGSNMLSKATLVGGALLTGTAVACWKEKLQGQSTSRSR